MVYGSLSSNNDSFENNYSYDDVLLTPNGIKDILSLYRPLCKEHTLDVIFKSIDNTYDYLQSNPILCLMWLIGCAVEMKLIDDYKSVKIHISDADKYLLDYYELVVSNIRI